jgi:endoglucanase
MDEWPMIKFKQCILAGVILLLYATFLYSCSGKDDNPASAKKQGDQQPDLPPPSTEPLDAFAQNRILGRGVNFGNMLEAPQEGDWGLVVQEAFFDSVKSAGFQSVRVPIRWTTHAQLDSPYTVNKTFFNRIEWVVTNALSRDLAAIINMHNYDEIYSDPLNHQKRFLAIWRQIAETFKNYPDNLFFELLNEPNSNLTAPIWNEFLAEGISIVRETNPARTIIVGPVQWNNVNSLGTLRLPEEERNIIVTFHYYNPFQFTHQGAEWVDGADAWLGTTWLPTPALKADVDRDLKIAADWGSANNRPLYMGEFGAYSRADMHSRELWTRYVRETAEKLGFSWGYWELASGFGVYDPEANEWRTPLLNALIPPN